MLNETNSATKFDAQIKTKREKDNISRPSFETKNKALIKIVLIKLIDQHNNYVYHN
jgi:hypothetical protein